MPRAVDLQLFALAALVGVLVAGLVARFGRRQGTLGAGGILAVWSIALVADRLLTEEVPRSWSVSWVAWVLVGVTVVVARRGIHRLQVGVRTAPLGIVLLAMSAVGVWAAVPETSMVVLVAGGLAGVTLIGALAGRWPAPSEVTMGAAGIAVAVAVGAVGVGHPLLGGLLCLSTFVVLGVQPRPRGRAAPTEVALAGLLHLATVVVAARHVGVSRSWGWTPLAVVVVVALAVLAAQMLRPRQRP